MAAMTLVSERIGQYFHDGHRIEYTEYGSGERWVVLVHGQLMPRRMHQPLARTLAGSGAHVVTVDLLGHGRSDRPSDPLLSPRRRSASRWSACSTTSVPRRRFSAGPPSAR